METKWYTILTVFPELHDCISNTFQVNISSDNQFVYFDISGNYIMRFNVYRVIWVNCTIDRYGTNPLCNVLLTYYHEISQGLPLEKFTMGDEHFTDLISEKFPDLITKFRLYVK